LMERQRESVNRSVRNSGEGIREPLRHGQEEVYVSSSD
jgi:hypothetical protein